MVPEDRERWIKMKIGKGSILGSHQFLLAGWSNVKNQKTLVFVLQMEKSKQSIWMG
jgi:hypothetical protein